MGIASLEGEENRRFGSVDKASPSGDGLVKAVVDTQGL
jgi:hypothetical protein